MYINEYGLLFEGIHANATVQMSRKLTSRVGDAVAGMLCNFGRAGGARSTNV